MRVLGVDPGLNVTGVAVMESEGGEPRLVWARAIRPPARVPLPERLRHLRDALVDLARDSGATEAAVEEVFIGVDPRAALRLGAAQAACLLALADAGISVHLYTSTRVKQTIAGHGRADKRQVRAMLRARLAPGAVLSPIDASDAAAVAACHLLWSAVLPLVPP